MLGVRHIYIRDDVHDASICLFRQAFILTPIASLHVEDGNMKALGADDRKAAICITQHQHGVRLHLHHQLVTLGDDIAHCFSKVRSNRIHVNIRVGQFKVLEENPIQIVVVVLSRMRQQTVEILTTFIDNCGQADDFRASADDDEKLKFPVILELCHIY